MKNKSEKGFFKSIWLKLLSLVIAFVIWLIVVNVDDYKVIKEIYNIPVEQINGEQIEEGGLVFDVTSGETVNIVIEGRRSIVNELTAKDFTATADLSKLSYTNTAKIIVEPNNGSIADKLSITVVDDAMTLSIEEKKSKQFELMVSTKGNVADGYALGKAFTAPAVVNVTGPESLINKIKNVRVNVDVTNRYEDFETTVSPVIYDGNDEIMSSSKLEMNVEEVKVTVPIYETKSVPIRFYTKGSVKGGYELTDITASINEIVVAGSAEDIERLSYISINDLDVSDISENTTFERSISNFLPENIYLADSVDTIVITVNVEELITKNFTITTDDIELINKNDELYVYTLQIQGAFVVSVTGLERNVGGLSIDDLNPLIDCNDLETGVSPAEVSVKLSSRYRVDKNGTVLITVAEKPEETTEEGATTEGGNGTTESGTSNGPEGTTEARNGNGVVDNNSGYANDTQSIATESADE
ncbi:MAG: hypothetical protein IJ703_03640 [Eubacterium sp.]|nr:hypothetical protein [Eubacterium sp.]